MAAKGLRYYFDLIEVLTKKEIKVRYKNSALGYLWSIANPLLYSLIFYFVFKVIMRFQIKDYTLFLITGLFPWQWVSNSVLSSAGVFLGNTSLIKKVIFPRLFLPLALVLNDAFHFFMSIPVIIIFLLLYGKSPYISWVYLIPLLSIPTFFVIYGMSLIVSSLNVFFRDLQYIMNLILTILFYLTPIFYTIDYVPEKYRTLVYLNPFTSMINSWREVFMNGVLDYKDFSILVVYSIVVFLVGYAVYRKVSPRFAEVV